MPMTVRVRIQRLRKSTPPLPAYHSARAAGLDLGADLDSALTIAPGARASVPTGIALEIPDGYEGQVRPRSGRAIADGLTLINSPGTIDSDYRGEVKVLLVNLGNAPVEIHPGDRIAQLIISPVVRVELVEVADLSQSTRGSGGFGHTGR
jgi:dUTP pyrophosphatase